MFEVVTSALLASSGPISGITRNGPFVMTAQIPKDPVTGELVAGNIFVQTRRTLENLRLAMEGAGGLLSDVMMVQAYLTEPADLVGMNEIWREIFQPPFPARATVVVKQLLLPGMLLEIVATAFIGPVRA